ncbi:MAG: putative pseudouridine synthase [Bacteroidetes bacterium]|nr:putative pseudouridine synthase [Bacteroidota bacterium]MDP2884610.1 pseudouridine synthase [Ignavibacteria bacterium]
MGKRPFSIKSSYILFYKPYGVLSQFSDNSGRMTLKAFGPFPQDIYPVGRLDADSEGLLLLTNDGPAKHLLLEPRHGHQRTYLVQVERVPSGEALARLRTGVTIEGRKTKQATVTLLDPEPPVPLREIPIRYRKSVPTAWLEIALTEGRNRQIRKMTAAVGHPTLRLIRIKLGPLTLIGLNPGEHRHLSKTEVQLLLASTDQSPVS